jgi:hypothetical protein
MIRVSLLKKKGVVITIFIPYSCNPISHYKNKQSVTESTMETPSTN